MPTPIDPRPRRDAGDWQLFQPKHARRVLLPDFAAQIVDMSFMSVLHRRRSARVMARAPFRAVAQWLSLSLRSHGAGADPSEPRSRRPTVSAGALHPIEVIVLRGSARPIALHFEAAGNAIAHLSSLNLRRTHSALDACRSVLPDAKGDFVFLLASTTKTAAYYNAPESLLWRDAGAVIQTLALTADALGLAFCPLGILGGEILAAIAADPLAILPVGVCAIGKAV